MGHVGNKSNTIILQESQFIRKLFVLNDSLPGTVSAGQAECRGIGVAFLGDNLGPR